jgi:3-hydroxyisobutyrate dehydrogenase-like beta-hydroxyacid dehydrogenase
LRAPQATATGVEVVVSMVLDAPVTGSLPRPQDGTLTIMVGGPEGDEDFAALIEALEKGTDSRL